MERGSWLQVRLWLNPDRHLILTGIVP